MFVKDACRKTQRLEKKFRENFCFVVFGKKCGETMDLCLHHTILPIRPRRVSNLIMRTPRKLTRPSINRQSPPLQLHYAGRHRRRALSCEKPPRRGKYRQRNISARWKIQLLFHTVDLPLIVISPRAPFGWISDFPFYAAGKRSFALVLPSMKRLFPLLSVDFVEKYRWRGYRSFVNVSFLGREVRPSGGGGGEKSTVCANFAKANRAMRIAQFCVLCPVLFDK